MPAVKKVETQLLISPLVKLRGLRLAVIYGESLAEIWRTALQVGLPAMEKQYAKQLDGLAKLNDQRTDGRTEAEWLRRLIDTNTDPWQPTIDF